MSLLVPLVGRLLHAVQHIKALSEPQLVNTVQAASNVTVHSKYALCQYTSKVSTQARNVSTHSSLNFCLHSNILSETYV